MNVRAEVTVSTTIHLEGDELYHTTEALRVLLTDASNNSLPTKEVTPLLLAMVEAQDKTAELKDKLRFAGIPETL